VMVLKVSEPSNQKVGIGSIEFPVRTRERRQCYQLHLL
jgi:hypothetical protein